MSKLSSPIRLFSLMIVIICLNTSLKAEINFRNINLAEAQTLAKTENKLIYVSFTAIWCAPCKVIEQSIYTDPEIISLINENFIAIKADVDTSHGIKWNELYNADYLPTIVFAAQSGNEFSRFKKVPTKKELKEKLLSYAPLGNLQETKTMVSSSSIDEHATPAVIEKNSMVDLSPNQENQIETTINSSISINEGNSVKGDIQEIVQQENITVVDYPLIENNVETNIPKAITIEEATPTPINNQVKLIRESNINEDNQSLENEIDTNVYSSTSVEESTIAQLDSSENPTRENVARIHEELSETNLVSNSNVGDVESESYFIQIGAFLNPANAYKLKRELSNQFDSEITILEEAGKNNLWHKVLFSARRTNREASIQLDKLKAQGYDGFIKVYKMTSSMEE